MNDTPSTQTASCRARRSRAADKPSAAGMPNIAATLAAAASAAPSWPGKKKITKLTMTKTALIRAAMLSEMGAPTA